MRKTNRITHLVGDEEDNFGMVIRSPSGRTWWWWSNGKEFGEVVRFPGMDKETDEAVEGYLMRVGWKARVL